MKYLIYLIAIIILLGINIGVFNNIQIKGEIPNLLFLLTLFFSLEKKEYDFFFISAASALFLDFYSTGFFGAFILGFLTVSLCVHFFVSNVLVFELNWKTLSFALLLCLLILDLVLWGYGLLSLKLHWTSQYVSFKTYIGTFVVEFLYNWILLYPVYLFFNFLRRAVDALTLRRRGLIR